VVPTRGPTAAPGLVPRLRIPALPRRPRVLLHEDPRAPAAPLRELKPLRRLHPIIRPDVVLVRRCLDVAGVPPPELPPGVRHEAAAFTDVQAVPTQDRSAYGRKANPADAFPVRRNRSPRGGLYSASAKPAPLRSAGTPGRGARPPSRSPPPAAPAPGPTRPGTPPSAPGPGGPQPPPRAAGTPPRRRPRRAPPPSSPAASRAEARRSASQAASTASRPSSGRNARSSSRTTSSQ